MKAKKYTRETIREIGLQYREFPTFGVGDEIAVSQWIVEGAKKRTQIFKGDVIAMHNNGMSTTFTVRKIGANGVAVERIYPYYSPVISEVEVTKRGDVRRAKLYYVRDRVGKKGRLKEMVLTKEERLAFAEKEQGHQTALSARMSSEAQARKDAYGVSEAAASSDVSGSEE